MRKYYVVIKVNGEAKLSAILTMLGEDATLVRVVPAPANTSADEALAPKEAVAPATAPKATETGHKHYRGGKRLKGLSSEELLLEVLGSAPRPFTSDDLRKAFVARGFAETSFTPPLYKLIKTKKVRNLGSGRYCLPGAVVKLGATA